MSLTLKMCRSLKGPGTKMYTVVLQKGNEKNTLQVEDQYVNRNVGVRTSQQTERANNHPEIKKYIAKGWKVVDADEWINKMYRVPRRSEDSTSQTRGTRTNDYSTSQTWNWD